MLTPGQGTWQKFASAFVRHTIARYCGKVTVIGREKVPMTGPVLLAPNHTSYLDPPLVGYASPRPFSLLAKADLFKGAFGKLISSLGAFPVHRGTSDRAAVQHIIEALKAGQAGMLFPEGTRGDGKTLGEIQGGFALIARRGNATIVPVGIVGSAEAMPRDGGGLKKSPITIAFGDPIPPEEQPRDRAEFAHLLATRLADATELAGRRYNVTSETSEAHPPSTEPDNPD